MTGATAKYLPLFVSESRRRLAESLHSVREIELGISDMSARDSFMRILRLNVHTLKGSSGSMQIEPMFKLAQAIEEVCDDFVDGKFAPDGLGITLLRRSLERLEEMVAEAASGRMPEDAPTLEREIIDYLRVARNKDFIVLEGNTAPHVPEEPSAPIREVDALGSIAELMAVAQQLRAWAVADPRLSAESARLESATRRLFTRLASLRQENFSSVCLTLRRQLNMVCARNDRKATLVVRGEETLVDPDVLSALQGPLVQLVNNAIVHGIEAPAERRRLSKPVSGQLELVVERIGEELVITFSDDGGGFNAELVRKEEARRADLDATETNPRGSRQPQSAINGADKVVAAAFEQGFSTLSHPTQDAGRGEGLSVVQQAVKSLGGRITVRYRAGRGATFRLEVPVAQRFEELLLVENLGQTHALPTRALTGRQTARTITVKDGGVVGVDRVLGTVEGLVCPPPFPFNLLPRVNGTTVGPDGTILFVVDPLFFPPVQAPVGGVP